MANGILKVSNIQTSSGSGTITLGQSGETVSVGSGVTLSGGFGVTQADQWRLSSDFTYSGSQAFQVLTGWERVDTDGYGKIGTGMTESSGIFTFPTTGIYLISFQFHAEGTNSANNRFVVSAIDATTDNSSYSEASEVGTSILGSTMGTDTRGTAFCIHQFDVTDTSTHKVRFKVSANNNNVKFFGNTNNTVTGVHFLRLGDT